MAEYTEAGLAIAINNKYKQNIDTIHPISDRLMAITLKGTVNISFINIYAYTATATQEQKELLYKQLKASQIGLRKQGPVYTMGDFNARIQKADNTQEEKVIGQHTFDKQNIGITGQADDVADNRELFISHRLENNQFIANTWFQKQDKQLCTFRKNTITHGPTWTRENRYETH